MPWIKFWSASHFTGLTVSTLVFSESIYYCKQHLKFRVHIAANVHYIPDSLSLHVLDPKHPSSWVEVVVQESSLPVPQYGTEISSITSWKIDSCHTSEGYTTTTLSWSQFMTLCWKTTQWFNHVNKWHNCSSQSCRPVGKGTQWIPTYKLTFFHRPLFAIWDPICSFNDAGVISLNRMITN